MKEAKFDVELDKARLFDSSFAANINDDTGIDAGLLPNMIPSQLYLPKQSKFPLKL